MYKKMLVPLDGSELAEKVLDYVAELAGRLDIEVILLHVSNPNARDFIPMHQAYIEHTAAIVRRQAREVQKTTGMPAGGKPVEVRGAQIEGYAAEGILGYAEKTAADLILISSHGRSGAKHWALGSVADKILRASKIPVFLVHAGVADETPYEKWPRRTILALLDGSELAERILPHVKALAQQRGTEPVEVVLLRVCEPPVTPTYYTPEFPGVPLNWGEYVEQEMARSKKAAADYLAKIEKQLKEENIKAQSKVLTGKAADVIVDYAKKNPFNVIVMATHGRSGLGRWVYGSVAENVLQAVTSPALLVRPQ